jgi:predicted ABC-type ATPase
VSSTPFIHVLAGTNGAGKSSVAGAAIRARGGDYFNPDEATRRIMQANPGLPAAEANSQGWREGIRLLERAIRERFRFAFETTLGGNTVPALLEQAHDAGLTVRMGYVGLETPELHLARVRSRVAAGGHDIPEAKIRERFDRSRQNLIRLLPALTDLRVHDNSDEGDPKRGIAPRPRLILSVVEGRIVETCAPAAVPQWAKPVFAATLRQFTR